MLFRMPALEAIREGRIDLAFRRWRRPTVRAGSRLRTAVGTLAVHTVDPLEDRDLTDADARRAGFADAAELLAAFPPVEGRTLYRVALRFAGADERVALREDDALSPADVDQLRSRLDRYDRASPRGPWARRYLALIRDNPAVRAAELAAPLGLETLVFKRDIRKLKELGLTESLETGYRISPRGAALLRALEDAEPL